MSRIKKLVSETAVYGVSSVLARLINFALVPIYLNAFPPSEYGVVVAIYTAVVFFNILFQYGMESAYLKYASGTEGRARAVLAFSTAFWSLLATSVGLSLLVVLLRGPIGDLLSLPGHRFNLMALALGFVSLDALSAVPFAELRLQNRPWRFAAVRLLSIGVNIGLNFWFIFGLELGILSIFLANIAASSVAVLLLLPVYAALLRPRFDRAMWAGLLRFGLPFVPSGFAYVLAERANVFFFGLMGRERVLALYADQLDTAGLAERAQAAAETVRSLHAGTLPPDALAAKVAEAIDNVYAQEVIGIFGGVVKLAIAMMLFAQMFRFAWQPFFLQHAEDADAGPLFARVFSLFTAAALFAFLAVSFFLQELVSIPLPRLGTLIPSTYWMALNIVPVALLAYVFQAWYYNFSVGVYIEKKTRYLVHCTAVASVVSLAVNAVFVPRFGMIAAAWAVLAAFFAMAMTLLFITRRFYRVPYAWGRVLGLGGWTAVLFSAWTFLPLLQVWWVEGLLLALYLVGVAGFRIVPPETFAEFWPRRVRA